MLVTRPPAFDALSALSLSVSNYLGTRPLCAMTANVLFAQFQLQIRNPKVAHTLVQMVYVIFSTDVSELVVVEIKLAMDIHHFVRHVV